VYRCKAASSRVQCYGKALMFVACVYIYCPAATVTLEGLDHLSEESCAMPAIYLNLGY